MAFHQMHLNKSGSGMTSKTACGRNVVNTPMSTKWESFKALPHDQQCAKCAASKQAQLNTRSDDKKAGVVEEQLTTISCHVPEKTKQHIKMMAEKLAARLVK